MRTLKRRVSVWYTSLRLKYYGLSLAMSGVPKSPSTNILLEETEKESQTLIQSCFFKFLLAACVVIYGSYTILMHLCEVDGKIPFSSSSMVLVIEILKLIISVILFFPDYKINGMPEITIWTVVPFSVPAVLYCINNNVSVHMQPQMDPTTYQVLSNLKIASTAVLYRIIMKRTITPVQWLALSLLTIAGISDSYGGLQSTGGKSAGEIHVTTTGILLMCVYCFLSGLAGVYTEYILKKQQQISLHLQNMMLYTFGIFLNGGVFFAQAARSEEFDFNLFKGYTLYTVVIIMTQACNGLIMSAVMKHSSNITRLFIISCAMLVTTVLSVLVFNLQINTYFICALALVIFSLWLYHRKS